MPALHIPICVGFSAPKLHTSAPTAILYTFVTWLSTTLPDWEKCFTATSGGSIRRESCFLSLFVHRIKETADPVPTKVFLKVSPDMAMLL